MFSPRSERGAANEPNRFPGSASPVRYRQSVLVLTDRGFQSSFSNRLSDSRLFFPGARLTNYVELLTGFGIPHATLEVDELTPAALFSDGEVHCSAVVFTGPLARIGSERWGWLEQASFEHGVTLVADSFLLSGAAFWKPFGIGGCSGLALAAPRISDAGETAPFLDPLHLYAPAAPRLGVRPILRFLMQSWFSRRLILAGGEPVAKFGSGRPAIVRSRFGKACNHLLNFHPSLALREGNRLHTRLREILESNTNVPAVAVDLSGVVCLRLDDPGSCERTHLEGFNPGVLSARAWEELLAFLDREKVHVNVAYVPQWVDDGSLERGSLSYRGRDVKDRIPGKHYDSSEVVYSRAGSPGSHDYRSECRAIRKGVDGGGVSILSHGLTHLTTDVPAWLKARDRHTKMEWYREFREMAGGTRAGAAEMLDRLRQSADLIGKTFGRRPEIIVPAAHETTADIPDLARQAGFRVFSSRSTLLLWKDRTVSNRKLSAFYHEDMAYGLELLRAGYPVTLVVHDYDILRRGLGWLQERLAEMRLHGAKRFLPLAEVAYLLMARLDVVREDARLLVTLDFSDSLEPVDSIREIRLRVGANVAAVSVLDQKTRVETEREGDTTILRVPVAALRDAKLRLCVLLAG